MESSIFAHFGPKIIEKSSSIFEYDKNIEHGLKY